MIYLAQFFNMAFPKAGLMYHNIPITVATLSFGMALVWVLSKRHASFSEIPRMFWGLYLLFAICLLLSIGYHLPQATIGQYAVVAVLIGSPLAIVLGIQAPKLEIVFRITAFSLIIVAAYAIAQWLFGLLATTIPGLNLSWGESWANKPIFIIHNGVASLVKYPSTYQNGNLVGGFYTISLPFVLAWRKNGGFYGFVRYLAIILGLIGICLCGSRSAFYPFVAVWLLICVAYVYQLRKPAFKELLAIAIAVTVALSLMAWVKPQKAPHEMMVKRYVVQTIQDPTGTNRTTQYIKATDNVVKQSSFNKVKVFLVGSWWGKDSSTEGVPSLFFYYGFPTMLFFLLLTLYSVYMATRPKGLSLIIALGLLGGLGHFLGDSNFYQPPTLINWFFLVGVSINQQINGELPD